MNTQITGQGYDELIVQARHQANRLLQAAGQSHIPLPIKTQYERAAKFLDALILRCDQRALLARRVVDAFDAHMAPMDSGGDSQETWAEVKAAIAALKEGT